MRLGCSQSSESKNDDSLRLTFTTNDGNICVIRTGLSVLLQPYFGGRFSLISSLFPFSVFLRFVFFLGRSRQKAAAPFRECSSFVGCSCFLTKVSGTWLMSEDRTITIVFSEAGGVTVG